MQHSCNSRRPRPFSRDIFPSVTATRHHNAFTYSKGYYITGTQRTEMRREGHNTMRDHIQDSPITAIRQVPSQEEEILEVDRSIPAGVLEAVHMTRVVQYTRCRNEATIQLTGANCAS